MRTQLCTTVPPDTRRQADELVARKYRTLSHLITILVDRAYNAEIADPDRVLDKLERERREAQSEK